MHPVLLSFGHIKIYSYGFMVALGVVSAIFLLRLRGAREGFDANSITDCAVFSVFAGIIGARLVYIVENPDFFRSSPIDALKLWEGGLVFYGGVGGALVFFIVFCFAKKISFLRFADLFVPALALAHMFGRVGCFLNGCCFGKPTDSFAGVSFPGRLDRLHPSQLYEAGFLFLLFVFLSVFYARRRFDGEVFLLYFIVYPAGRFVLEFSRGDQCAVFAGLAASQFVSLGVLAGALTAYCFMRRRYKDE